jgi:hypothetical protein
MVTGRPGSWSVLRDSPRRSYVTTVWSSARRSVRSPPRLVSASPLWEMAGSIVTRADPADRRRLLIWPAAEVSERVAEIRSTSVDATVAAALGTDDPRRVAEVVAALELLAGRLSPRHRPGRHCGRKVAAMVRNVLPVARGSPPAPGTLQGDVPWTGSSNS